LAAVNIPALLGDAGSNGVLGKHQLVDLKGRIC
jgi:hypothetical protein